MKAVGPDGTVTETVAQLVDLTAFRTALAHSVCPFCGGRLRFYDGALGYSSQVCDGCPLEVGQNGITFRDERT